MKDYFEFKNYDDAISLDAAIIRGVNYRITILSDILVRIEYNANGKFADRPTELVKFRKFDVPVPPMDLQKQFGDFVHRVDKSKDAVQKSLDKLQILFDKLMQEYFG